MKKITMNEVGRIIKKVKIVISSRGIKGLLIALKSYLYKNVSFLSRNIQKTGDVLLVGEYGLGVNELVEAGYICKSIAVKKINTKYIDLYDVFYFSKDALTQVQHKNFELIKKYNKLIIDESMLDSKGVLAHIEKRRAKKIIYVSSSTNISGGVMVIAEHLQQLQKLGFNTSMVSQDINIDMSWKKNFDMPILHIGEVSKKGNFIDHIIATFWDTVSFVKCIKADKKYYLVQGKEHFFYDKSNPFYKKAKNTYKQNNFEFLTVSKWCQRWLKTEFNQNTVYIPNCINVKLFNNDCKSLDTCLYKNNKGDKKIRVLIEGNPESKYKNVDEAFEITSKLDKDKFEVWFISYGGKSKKWYKYDKCFQKVPYYKMPEIYRSCDILLKTSKLESFSYSPLEMMACGGLCVVAKNDGNSEYIRDGYNALTYNVGNIDEAVNNINIITGDKKIRGQIKRGGMETVQNRKMDTLKQALKKVFC